MSPTPSGRGERVVFVTRKFPPAVGGMETFARDIWAGIQQRWPDAQLLALGRAKWHFLWWLPIASIRVMIAVLRRRVDVLIVGDAVVATALRPVLALRPIRSVAFVMGLDLTWTNRIYQRVIRWGLTRWGGVAAISEATAVQARERLGHRRLVEVVQPGIDIPGEVRDHHESRRAVQQRWDITDDELILVTLGRIIRRKGARWFAENVLPRLPNARYIVAGDGADSAEVARAAERAGVADRLLMPGRVSDEEREQLLAGCDLFVQPNIVVPGDMEGFGLVMAEAAVRGAVVLGADIEGIKDAIKDRRTGFLVPSGDPDAWVARIDELSSPGTRAQWREKFTDTARDVYSYQTTVDHLQHLLGRL